MNRATIRQISVVLAALATIVINVLANALPFNGQNTGVISDRFKVFFVPAGYVFSIWGIIYIGLIAYAVYQAMPAQRDNQVLKRIVPWFLISSAANIAWIFLWHYNVFALTIIVMAVLLVSLIAIYLALSIGKRGLSNAERWAVHVPFSIYLGWITVATVANATALLWLYKWNGFGISPEAWTIIMLIVGAALGGLMSFTRRDVAYSLVIVWAFAGIAVKWSGTTVIAVPATILAVAVGLMLAAARLQRRAT
jgi:hypothetical protein